MNSEDIARYYITAPVYNIPFDVRKKFRQFIINIARTELQGINLQYVDFQPYLKGKKICHKALHADVNQGKLLVSTQFNESALLNSKINLIFRGIHDIHHVKLNADFSWQGECASTRHIMSFTDNVLFQQLLFSEILGQSAVYLHTRQFPKHQKVVLFERDVLHWLAKD